MVMDHKPLLALFVPNKVTPLLAANSLARWALLLNQNHGNADALSSLSGGNDLQIDGEEVGEDVDNVCIIPMISHQMVQDDPRLPNKETSKYPVLTQVMHCVKEGWPNQC